MEQLGHVIVGDGPQRVVVLHDWLGDHRSYDPVLPYLDPTAATYAFADLRGYGLSRDQRGRCDLDEAAADVRALARHLGWPRFHVVGHSMSSLVAQQVAADAPDAVASLVLVTPIAPRGMGTPAEVVGFLEQVGGDEVFRRGALAAQFAARLSEQWFAHKLRRWASSAAPDVVRAYVPMFATTALRGSPAAVSVLVILGAHDAEPFREATVRAGFSGAYPDVEYAVSASAGHYPMEETPPWLASRIEDFVRRHAI